MHRFPSADEDPGLASKHRMRRARNRSARAYESLEPRHVLTSGLLVTEFQAINDGTLADGDGVFSDWIELHNPTSESISLLGWHLSDDRNEPQRWPLPDVELGSGEYLVIFASGEDKIDPAGYYHANFKLDGQGEDLLLVAPDGVTYDDIFLNYPEQFADGSYGTSVNGITETLIAPDAPLTYRVPTSGESSTDWTELDFDDAEFTSQQSISGSDVVITELGTSEQRFVEIQNVSHQPIDTSGWTLAINDPTQGPHGVLATEWQLPAEIAAGQILYRSDQPADNYWGATIPWDAEGPGWALLLDALGSVQDFVAWGYSDAQIDAMRLTTAVHSEITLTEHWEGQGANVGSLGDVASDPVAVGPGAALAGANDADSAGIRLNIEPTYATTLDAGTYDVQDIAFASSSDGTGEIRAFLAVRTDNTPTYEILWASAPTTPPAGDGIHQVTFATGSQQFTLAAESEVFAGVWHDGNARVRFSGNATVTNHDNSPIVPTSPGQTIEDFSHGSLNNRTYAYHVTVANAGVARPALARHGFLDNNSADDFDRDTMATMGQQNPNSNPLFGGLVPTRAGIGFHQDHVDFEDAIQTNVADDMFGVSPSLWTRFAFESTDLSDADEILLRVRYDDGFQAYLDGVPLVARNAPTTLSADSTATTSRTNAQAMTAEDIDVRSALANLAPGQHVLAVHVLNASPSDTDLLFAPELVAHRPSVAQFFEQPTPGTASTDQGFNTVADTKFSVDRGFYDAPLQVEITTETIGAKIAYTLDGSPPQVDASGTITYGTEYVTPLTITGTSTLRALAFKPGLRPSNVDTQTYLFTDDVATQTRQATIDAGFPTSWGGRGADYGIDPDVVGPNDRFNGVYTESFAEDLKSLPTLSLVLDTDAMFGSQGIYSNVNNRGEAWERPVFAELIYPDGQEGFQIDAGIRMHGGASRSLSRKNNFRLLFKEQYGASKLEFPLFGDGVDRFDTLVLRSHFNDGWGWSGAGGDPLFSRDEWHRQTQAAMGHTAARGMGVHLYINGIYWGLYNPSERPDASFAAQHMGGDKTEWDVMNHNGVADGSTVAWNQMLSLANAVDRATTEAAQWEAYQRLQGNDADGNPVASREAYLDLENYIDYLALNFYSGNDDWPNRNWYAARRQGAESEGFQFFAWDSEISLDLSERTHLHENVVVDTNNNANGAAAAYGALRQYEEFQLDFADRVHKHFFNDGVFYTDPEAPEWDPAHPERNPSAARMAAISRLVADAVVAESARWGDQHRSLPYTRDAEWQQSRDHLLEDFFPQRRDIVLAQLRNANLYPQTDAPEFTVQGVRHHGGYVERDTLIGFQELDDATATVWYTTDGSDPRLPGGAINTATAIRYSGPFSIARTSTLQARVLQDGEWSALTEATFAINPTGLRWAEVHYKPAEPTDQELGMDPTLTNDQFEFVEFVNVGEAAVDLSGMQITGGIQYTFPLDQQLAAGERIVVVRDADAFAIRYGDQVEERLIAGEYQSALSNSGERIRLQDALGQVLSEFEYSDSWWDETDGNGYSLVVRDPADLDADLNQNTAWQPSLRVGGSPGADDGTESFPEDFNRNGTVDFADFLLFSSVFGSFATGELDLFDLDESGDIGFGDFLRFSAAFGRSRDPS